MDPQTIWKNTKSASFYIPPAIESKVKLLVARASKTFTGETTLENSSPEDSDDEEIDAEIPTEVAFKKTSTQIKAIKPEVQTPEIEYEANQCGETTTDANGSMGESFEKSKKRKRVRRHKSRKKEEVTQFDYQFTLPTVSTHFQTTVSKSKHIHFDNDTEEHFDVGAIQDTTDETEEFKAVDNLKKQVSEQHTEPTTNDLTSQEAIKPTNRKRRAGSNKTFSIGNFLTHLRMENKEAKPEDPPLTDGNSSFEQPEKKKRVRCRKSKNISGLSVDNAIDESSEDTTQDVNNFEGVPVAEENGVLSTVRDPDQNYPATVPCSTPNFESDPNTSLQQLFSLRKTYGSPPVFIRNLERADSVVTATV